MSVHVYINTLRSPRVRVGFGSSSFRPLAGMGRRDTDPHELADASRSKGIRPWDAFFVFCFLFLLGVLAASVTPVRKFGSVGPRCAPVRFVRTAASTRHLCMWHDGAVTPVLSDRPARVAFPPSRLQTSPSPSTCTQTGSMSARCSMRPKGLLRRGRTTRLSSTIKR